MTALTLTTVASTLWLLDDGNPEPTDTTEDES